MKLFDRTHSLLHDTTIGRKFFIQAVLVSSISLCIAVLGVVVTMDNYQVSETAASNTREIQIRYAIDNLEKINLNFARDYAHWDDMAEGVRNEDVSWMQEAFSDSFSTYKLDGIWIHSLSGKPLYSRFSPQLPKSLAVASAVIENLPYIQQNKQVSYYQYTEGRLIHFASYPVQYHTQQDQTIYGMLTIGEIWSDPQITYLENVLQAKIKTQLVPDEQTSFFYHRKHFVPLTNLYDQIQAYLQIDFVDHSLDYVWKNLIFVQILIISAGGALIFLSHRAQHAWYIQPIDRISQKINKHLKSRIHVQSQNELVLLEAFIDQFIIQDHEVFEKKEKLQDLSKQLRRELQVSKRLSQAVEASTDGVVITNTKGSIIYTNPAWQKMNGYTQEEAKGKNPRILQSGRTPKDIYVQMWNALVKGKSFRSDEIVNKRKDGSEWNCQLAVFPIDQDGVNTYYVGLQQDISKRKEVEKLKTEFISLASHQLRTPLSATRWFSELLLEQKKEKLSRKQKELVVMIHESVIRMIELVNALLNISRLESGRVRIEPKTVHLEDVIASVVSELAVETDRKKLHISTKLPLKSHTIYLDPQLIRELIANLVTNAVKYTNEKGTVKITLENHTGYSLLKVSDDGMGIPAKESDRLFSKFFRGSNVTQTQETGTGLGLYLAKKIVELMKGKIWFESVENKGTTFFVTIPHKGMESHAGTVKLES